MQKTDRPLSPHLQVYRLPLSALMSISHRITGAALSVGCLLIVIWLAAAALGPEPYDMVMNFMKSPLGLFVLFGWSFSLYYHLFNGLRHLIWDAGYLLKMRNADIAGCTVLALTVLATALTWYFGYGF